MIKFLSKTVTNFIYKKIKKKRINELKIIPKIKIKNKHTKNGIILPAREDLLKLLTKKGVIAEIGVDEGLFTEKIISITKPKKMHLIDIYNSTRYGQNKILKVKKKFLRKIKAGSLEINRSLSIKAAKKFKDNYFDWIYIDTDHSYSTTIKELYAYESKIKPNGIIAGHDYVMGNWAKSLKYGVIEAVAEFCVKKNWKIIYLTADFTENNSFAIQRINN